MTAGAKVAALVLAAGRGERLRPLTDEVPKPLLPVAGRPLLTHTLRELVAIGCRRIAINLHHRGDDIARALGPRFEGAEIVYSHEPRLLGTLGALGPLRAGLRASDLVLVINGDSLSPWPLRRLLRHHQECGAVATLLLARRADPERFGGGVALAADGRLLALRGPAPPGTVARQVFAGAHVVASSLLDRVADGPGDFVRDLYEPLLAEGALLASVSSGLRWHDLGTPERYLEGVLDWVASNRLGRVGAGSAVDPRARVAAGARIESSVVEADATIAGATLLRHSVVLPGATVADGAILERVVVGPGVDVPAGTHLARTLITRAAAATPPLPPPTIRQGALLLTPFESAPQR